MLLSIAIQHHPQRPLPGPLSRYEVVDDPEPEGPPSAIRTYLECLRRTPDCTHRLILQDDVELVPDFETKVLARLAERPGCLVAFFTPGLGLTGKWVREAHERRERWCELPMSANWRPVVALCWPADLVPRFLDYAEALIAHRASHRKGTYWDDPVVGSFVRAQNPRLPVWATVPCLVEHLPGWSIVKGRDYTEHNRARRAAAFTGE